MKLWMTLLDKSLKSKFQHLSYSTKKQTPAEYCTHLVRKHDYENFICTLLLPSDLRSFAFSIRAFNTEIALVEDQVQDNNIGLMRLKFWEEALNGIYKDQPPVNPTCLELHRVLKKKKVSKHYLKRLIQARINRLNSPIIINLEFLENYAENTSSSIYYMLLEAQGIKDVNIDHFASHLGRAQGIVNSIRSIPHNLQKRKIDLPQDILMKYNLSTESFFQRTKNKELVEVIYDVSSRAKQHLEKAKSLKRYVTKESKSIFLPLLIVDNYLEKLRRADFDVFNAKLNQRNHFLPLELWFGKVFSKNL